LHEQRAGGHDLGAKLTEVRAERDAALAESAKKIDALRSSLITAKASSATAEQRAAELTRVNAEITKRLDAEAERAFQLAEEARTSSHRTIEDTDLQRARFIEDLAKLEQQLAEAGRARAELEQQVQERDRIALEAGKEKVAAEKKEQALVEKLREVEERSAHAEESLKSALEQLREAACLRSTLDLMREQHAQELEEAAKAHTAAIDASHAQQIAALEAQTADLSKALARSRENLDAERRNRLEEEAQTMTEMDALEAAVAEKDAELTRVRADLERESRAVKAALDQLESDRTLIAQAKTLLSELVARSEPDE
jgi:DNA repair exonuclease SbcCD ATPase subunit